MQIISLGKDFGTTVSIPKGCVMVFGFFDGVHLGHRALISEAKEYATKTDRRLCVWSFSAMPKTDIHLTTNEEKTDILREIGADYVVFEDFDKIRDLDPREFFNSYVMNLFSPCAVFCGFNFRFGKNASGSTEDFKKLAAENGIEGFSVEPFEEDGTPVSSSRIRALIKDGDIIKANQLLGYPYSVSSPVVHGKQIGRKLGFATINQLLPAGKTLPKFGVYATRVVLPDGKSYRGVSNIGSRPTVNDDSTSITLETHILDWDGNAYDENVKTEMLLFIRPEQKFDNPDALSKQIKKDAASAIKFFDEAGTGK